MRFQLLKTVMFSALLASGLTFFSSDVFPSTPPSIRVQVLDQMTEIILQSSSPGFVVTDDKEKTRTFKKTQLHLIAEGQNRFRLDSKLLTSGFLKITHPLSTFTIAHRTFHGTLLIASASEKTFMVINELPLESYLVGIINSEISSSWPLESIKAQAVAARTYASATLDRTKQSSRLFDIRGTVDDQVYHGTHLDDARSANAVKATAGEVLVKEKKPLMAYYHSCCGGQTEHAHNAWEHSHGPPTVIDHFCEKSPKLTWEYRIPLHAFEQLLRKNGHAMKGLLDISTTQLPDSPRNSLVLITDQDRLHTISATEIRKIFGYQNIRSTWFNVGIENGAAVFAGRGYGHGVGMCQWGAKGMDEGGNNYRDILKFYYSDAELMKTY